MTGGVLVWLAVKAAMAVLVPAIRGGPSVTDPAGLAVPDTAGGFFGVLHHWDSNYFLGIAADIRLGSTAHDCPTRCDFDRRTVTMVGPE